MASKYTSFIENGKCTSAKQFLKLCLRNFGVMQMYRDEPLSLDFEPDFAIQKDYVKNSKVLIKLKEQIDYWQQQLDNYLNFPFEFQVKILHDEYSDELNVSKERFENEKKLNSLYEKFIKAINSWECSDEFKNIKNFAIEECEDSKFYIDFSYYEQQVTKYEKLLESLKSDPHQVVNNYINYLKSEVEKRKKFFNDEIDRLTNLQNLSSNKKFYDKFLKEIESVEF